MGQKYPTETVLSRLLQQFARWAMAETSAPTIGAALREAISASPDIAVWNNLQELPLEYFVDPSQYPLHPSVILHSWASRLDIREQRIFGSRIAFSENQQTLQEFAQSFGITRERVRQIESRVRRRLTAFLEARDALPIRWRIDTLRRRIGVAAPIHAIEFLLEEPDDIASYSSFLLNLAGPYITDSGWLVLKSASESDPLNTIDEFTDHYGRIDLHPVEQALCQWGLDRQLHIEWLTKDGRIREFNNQLILWGNNIQDRLAFALDELGSPATLDTLIAYVNERRARTSALNALSSDSRFTRVNPTEWALTEWGLPEYISIAMAIHDYLEDRTTPTAVNEIVEHLSKSYGLVENSIRAYCQAPLFVMEGGLVRLRNNDETYSYPANALKSAPGVFAIGPGRVSLIVEIDHDVLRGSGHTVPYAVGAITELAIGALATFYTIDGDPIVLTFPVTSFTGPALGSIRSVCEKLTAGPGQFLTLLLDCSDMSAKVNLTNLVDAEPSWRLVEQLTAIGAGRGIEGLAQALQCTTSEVRGYLVSRGDTHVLSALPPASGSANLERALFALQESVQAMEG